MKDSKTQKWEGRWDQLKGKIRRTWGEVTDDDLDVMEGNYDELIGRVEERTGETRERIEQRLAILTPNRKGEGPPRFGGPSLQSIQFVKPCRTR